MKSKIAPVFATVMCTTIWVITIIALPFIEDYFYPSNSNSSWQRGIILTPLAILPALIIFHFITTKAIQAGSNSYLYFLGKSSLYGFGIFLSFSAPTFIVTLLIGTLPLSTLLWISVYASLIMYFSQLVPLSIWWLIAARDL